MSFISNYFLQRLLSFVLLLGLSVQLFIWTIDPYGVSPIGLQISGFNTFKPMRLDINRQIKPFEVWWKQPKTVFLGTSRIHQSLDPMLLDGTELAPAYNASIPGSVMQENEQHFQDYLELNRSIENVVSEVFLYQLAVPFQPHLEAKPRDVFSVVKDVASLFGSLSASLASVKTIFSNVTGYTDGATIHEDGYWVAPTPYRAEMPFHREDYSEGIVQIHVNVPDLPIQATNTGGMATMQETGGERGVAVNFFLTPTHPWDDYRLLSLGYWGRVEEMYRAVSKFDNVFGFSLYNEFLTEPQTDELPASQSMEYWYDPVHFNREFGGEMLKAWAGLESDVPAESVIVRITPETVEQVIENHRRSLARWAEQNPSFVEAFEANRHKYCLDDRSCKRLGFEKGHEQLGAGNGRGQIDDGVESVGNDE
jgi:hypothetical protein